MSHELRTPLNAIMGFSEVMKDEVLGPIAHPTYRDYAANILDSGRHLLTLINQILDLSRIEAGRYDLNEEPLTLADIVDDCQRLLQLKADSKSLVLKTDIEAGLPCVRADERAVRQICLNLLSNAIKFTPSGGTVTILLHQTPDGGQTLAVRDTGPGIPRHELTKVLQPFGQGTLAQQTAEGGTGLGLPIVQNLIELHGGTLELLSEVRRGTEARVTFPAARCLRPSVPAQPTSAQPAATQPGVGPAARNAASAPAGETPRRKPRLIGPAVPRPNVTVPNRPAPNLPAI
jgi:two-component system cell cycle sensor histidine kinase PleC